MSLKERIERIKEIEKASGRRPIYPDVNTHVFGGACGTLAATTVLRKKDRYGDWYQWRFYQEIEKQHSPEMTTMLFVQALGRLHEDVYKTLLFGVVDPTLEDENGNPIFELDEDQREESDRLLARL